VRRGRGRRAGAEATTIKAGRCSRAICGARKREAKLCIFRAGIIPAADE
jgi:hypothetical protein